MTAADSLTARLAGEMADRWRAGGRPVAEEFLDRHPGLWDRADAALELVAEELALRDEFAAPVSAAELAARFPRWAAEVRTLLDCQRALGPHLGPPAFPEPGEVLGPFRVGPELGRGGFGRVYRATQPALGCRPVVLKVGPADGGEHLALARLQHTHVVPLFSAHDFPERGLRALCLPDFGGRTLAESLPRARRGGAGRELLSETGSGPGRAFLERASLPAAACWVGACLADALRYAHDRGVLHLDLKPSNVLVAADGTPMLLDFHLARPPLAAGDPPPAWLGGTPGYMAPELEAAVGAVRDGRPVPAAVDGRADVFALGVLLRELVGAAAAPVGLSDILARAAAADPAARYPTAAALAADLRRQLTDLPLRGVANRSPAERWGKWRRRRPYALPLLLALVAVVLGAAGLAVHAARLAGGARDAERAGREHLAAGRYAEAAEAFRGGEALAAGVPFGQGVRERLRAGRAAADLARLADRVRPLFAAEFVAPAEARAVAARCREVWDRREALAAELAGEPDPRWRDDLVDVALAADAGGGGHAVAEEAARLFGPGRPRGDLLAGRAHLAAGDFPRAVEAMDRCLAADPRATWAHYYKGVACLRLGRAAEAVAAFSACAARAPDSAWCAHNRGLALAAAGAGEAARADFDRALALDPGLAAAYLGRAAVHHAARRAGDALADLDRAAAAGAPAAEVEYRRAVVRLAGGDRPAAAGHLRSALRADPGHGLARELSALLGPSP